MLKKRYLKGILIMVMVMFMICFNKTNTSYAQSITEIEKPLILVKGYDYQSLLQYEGYGITSSDVNFQQAGSYVVNYLNLKNKQTYQKKVYVIENNDKPYIYYDNKKELVKETITDKTIENLIKINDHEYVYLEVSTYRIDDYIYHNYDLVMVSSGTIKWVSQYKRGVSGEIVKLIYDDEKIIGISNQYVTKTKNDIYLFGYNLEGHQLFDKCYGGSNHDSVCEIVEDDDNYYLAGSTMSNDGCFLGTRNKEDSFILVVNKDTLEKVALYNLGLELNDTIKGMVISQDGLYIAQTYIENSDIVIQRVKLCKLSFDGFIQNEKIFYKGYGFDCLKLINNQQYIYMLTNTYLSSYSDTVNEVYQIDYDLKYTLIDQYYNEVTVKCQAMDLIVTTNETIGVLYRLFDTKNAQEGCLLRIIIQEEKLNYEPIAYRCYDNKGVCFVNDELTYLVKTDDTYQLINNDYLVITSLGSYMIKKPSDNVYDYTLYANGTYIKHNDELSDTTYNPNMFGQYQIKYYFKETFVDIVYYYQIYVLPYISVSEGETYDKLIKLNFNGEGYLNGEKVLSGIPIETEGEYTLKVVGKTSQAEVVHFKVETISERPLYERTILDEQSNDQMVNITSNQKESSKLNLAYEVTSVKEENNSTIWTIFIPLISLVFSILIVNKKRG